MRAKQPGRKPSKQPWGDRLDLWFAVEQMIGRGDLVVLNEDLIWFHNSADATTQDMGQLLREWRTELVRLVRKDAAAKAQAAKGAARGST